jgi:formylglycine-generating enzyme required for sulfatase activity
VADFGAEVVINAALLETMISLAEPGGVQANRQHEMLFIILKHYLERTQGLVVLPRQDPVQRPLLVTSTCTPYTAAPAHMRRYVSDLTEEQKRALVAYRDLAWPRSEPTRAPQGTMARIPAGPLARSSGPPVTLEAFAIDVYEVTNAQYRQFIEAHGYTTRDFWTDDGWSWLQQKSRRQPSYWDQAPFNAPNLPVVGVTWYEAEAYCRWAGKTLPTELQWEKACRGNDARRFPWGNDPLPQAQSTEATAPEVAALRPVGSSLQTQSPYGVHDMAGNALEWTLSRRDGQQIVLCGGSGHGHRRDVGCDVRYTLLPGISANFIGFRCQAATP